MSQLDAYPDPSTLPFRIVSKTIGRGAYASIKKVIPLDALGPVYAVKFINKPYALSKGRLSAKQIKMEVSLHSHVGKHKHIIEWFATDEDDIWRWIAMEYAAGGDLFDKIEADVGVSEDIAHHYFKQLISAISFMHSKGVAHRDIKPENILLSGDGDLKIADFGLATLFEYKGKKKKSTTFCGSPPYIAPEVITASRAGGASRSLLKTKTEGYEADLVDIWSCGVVLFVLLVGNTPWDEPTYSSWEFKEYAEGRAGTGDDLWSRLPHNASSLLRGMMSIDFNKRMSMAAVRRHPWYTRKNKLLEDGDELSQTTRLALATQMLEKLHIPNQAPQHSQSWQFSSQDDRKKCPKVSTVRGFSSTQPELPVTPMNEDMFDWERPARSKKAPSASQPVGQASFSHYLPPNASLIDEPMMSQFAAVPKVPMSLTQHAQRFADIVPASSMNVFWSPYALPLLLDLLGAAMQLMGQPCPVQYGRSDEKPMLAWIRVRTTDQRHCHLNGIIDIEEDGMGPDGVQILQVKFTKIKGDPLEWRRFFKKIVWSCQEGVYRPPVDENVEEDYDEAMDESTEDSSEL